MSCLGSSGVRARVGDVIHGYTIEKVFEPGGFAFAAQAKTSTGRKVFLKKYKRPGGRSSWYEDFISYQDEIKGRVQGDAAAN